MNREPPYYKQLDPTKQPGQIINKPIVTISDYVEKVLIAEAPPPKKLTFDEWSNSIDIEDIDFVYASRVWDLMESAWIAAQENK